MARVGGRRRQKDREAADSVGRNQTGLGLFTRDHVLSAHDSNFVGFSLSGAPSYLNGSRLQTVCESSLPTSKGQRPRELIEK